MATPEDKTVVTEIDAAVKDASEKAKADREEREKQAGVTKKDLPGGDTAPEEEEEVIEEEGPETPKTKDDDEPDEIDDTMLERAVKAGMSMSEARSFRDKNALERVCGVMEKAAAKAVGDNAGGKKDDGDASSKADPLDSIPDLDHDEYDEKVVAGFKALKEIIRGQQSMIKALQDSGRSAQGDWFDGQVQALGESAHESLGKGEESKLQAGSPQAGKRAELREKFDVLTAGYKAAGKDVDRATVFQEAVKMVVGDLAAATEAKRSAIERRASQRVARPGGSRTSPKKSVEEEAAALIDERHFKD